MAEILDMRGRAVAATPSAVLADPSGRRARRLNRAGRLIALAFCAWLVGLVLAGLGVLPTSIVPLSRQIGAVSPPALASAIRVTPPSRSDLIAARPESSLTSGAASFGRGTALLQGSGTHSRTASKSSQPGTGRHSSGSGRGSSGSGSGHATSTGVTPVTSKGTTPGSRHSSRGHGRSGAPGQTRHLTNPGHSKTATHGRSGSSPGHQRHTTTTTTTTTAPGKSGSAPGHSGSQGSGRGHRH